MSRHLGGHAHRADSSAAPSLRPPSGLLRGGEDLPVSASASAARIGSSQGLLDTLPEGEADLEDLERMIVLLLGSGSGPVPSSGHLQREMYMLTKVDPVLEALFRFEPYPGGPHSPGLQRASLEPLQHAGAYEVGRHGEARLTAAGHRAYGEMVSGSVRMRGLAGAASFVRHVYDGVDADEFLFLISDAYSGTAELSGMDDRYKDPKVRRRLADSLVDKGIITTERYRELIGNGWAYCGLGRQYLLHVPA